jgi:hypothetical protein
MITQLAYPSGEPSIQDALWHVFNTNVTGQTDFKYVMDLYVGGTQQVRVKLFPDPSNNKGYFDAGNVVRNTMTYDWLIPSETFLMCEPNVSGQVAQTYQYRIGEEYSGTTFLNQASGNITAYNWNAPLFKRRQVDATSKTNKWFTNRPTTINASLTDNIFIPFKSDVNLTLKVSTFDNSNNLIANNVDAVALNSKKFLQCNIGVNALNTRFGSTIINSSVKYYQVWFNSLDKITVYLDCNGRYDSYNLHFLNDWGMFDTAKFNLVSKLSMDIERKGFEKRDYSFGSTSVDYYANNKYVESKINYQNKKDFTYKLTMNAPTDEEYQWLAELVASPQIYFEYDGYYYPVTIKATNYEFSKYVNNRLRVFEVEIEMNQTRYSQLR